MSNQSKTYRQLATLVDREKSYEPQEAFGLLKQLAKAKFDETVDCVFRLGIDAKKSDQQVRGTVSLPHGTGKSVRVAVIASGELAKQAKEAGADLVGEDDLIGEIQKGNMAFDILVAHPNMMSKVGRLGKLLGPRGLMPTPKSGTVAPDVAKAVKEFKAGKIEYKTDKQGNVHTVIGKASFTAEQLLGNFTVVLEAVRKAKPASAKGIYLKKVTISPTMGPSIRLSVN